MGDVRSIWYRRLTTEVTVVEAEPVHLVEIGTVRLVASGASISLQPKEK